MHARSALRIAEGPKGNHTVQPWSDARELDVQHLLGHSSPDMVRRYRRQLGSAPSPTWRSFLRLHAHAVWACDFFTVQTLPVRTLSVFLFISHDRRRILYWAVTAHPTAPWVWQQVIQATPENTAPQFLIHDRDRNCGGDFVRRAARLGIRTVRTPARRPRRTRSRSGACGRSGWSVSTT